MSRESRPPDRESETPPTKKSRAQPGCPDEIQAVPRLRSASTFAAPPRRADAANPRGAPKSTRRQGRDPNAKTDYPNAPNEAFGNGRHGSGEVWRVPEYPSRVSARSEWIPVRFRRSVERVGARYASGQERPATSPSPRRGSVCENSTSNERPRASRTRGAHGTFRSP